MELWITFDISSGRGNVYRTKMPEIFVIRDSNKSKRNRINGLCEFNLTIWTNILEILVTEDQNFPLSGKQSKFIQPLLRQFGYLDAGNFSAEVWANVTSGDIVVEETRFLRVCPTTRIDMI